MKKFVSICISVTLFVLTAGAQQRIPCDRSQWGTESRAMARGSRTLPAIIGEVRVPVILTAFSDHAFSLSDEEIYAYWDALLNQNGYSEHGAAGCVADYFKKQSGGKYKPIFDVMGPVKLPQKKAYYGKNLGGMRGADRRSNEMLRDACVATERDFLPYDKDEDGTIDVVVIIYAGAGENRGGGADAIWPHKGCAQGKSVGDMQLGDYACVCELRNTTDLDGYGTFIHEFSHCFQLPDLYPTSGSSISIFDEWDLMDGGNYSNNGFSPPNYSALERWICGWCEFEELTNSVSITDLPAWDEDPKAYVIRNTAHPEEYYILENRQQQGNDNFIPGNGLLVTHVIDYEIGNLTPNTSTKQLVSLVPADNRQYRESRDYFSYYISDALNRTDRSLYLSQAAYPYIKGDSINDHLTNTSIPSAVLEYANSMGEKLLSKPITNIKMDSNGHISFDFMMEEATGILDKESVNKVERIKYIDLQGRSVTAGQQKGILIKQMRMVDGTLKSIKVVSM